MTDKKDPGKFTIRFNICDPQHKAVIDLLNRQGRSKAQFLVSAVLHYINCKETPEVSVPVPNQAALEELILAILAKNQSHLKKQPESPTKKFDVTYAIVSVIAIIVLFSVLVTAYYKNN